MGAALLLAFLTACCLVLLHFTSAQQVLGGNNFLSLDCGGDSTAGFLDQSVPDIRWQSDGQFIATTGSVGTLASPASIPTQLQRVRFFPAGSSRIKNCYSLPVSVGNQHLIRAGFLYGNYDGLGSPTIQFQIAVNNTVWESVNISGSSTEVTYYETIIAPALGSIVFVCLIRSGNDAPFINSLELREFIGDGYNLRTGLEYRSNMRLVNRINFGGGSSSLRYPDDPLDRIWPSDTEVFPGLRASVLSAPPGQKINSSIQDQIPLTVLRTALTGPNITYSRQIVPQQIIYAYAFWAELNGSVAPNSRVMDSHDNFGYGQTIPPSAILPFVARGYGYTRLNVGGETQYSITFSRNNISKLDAIVNADELYYIVAEVPGTDPTDVAALDSLTTLYNITMGIGDPCKPVAWEEVTCEVNSDLVSRVTALDLSGKGLTGAIPADILVTLSELQNLTLRNNSFSGSIPYVLQRLTLLKVLDLANNHLDGSLDVWMQSLISLDVSNNQLNGSFPSTLLYSTGFKYLGNPLLQCYEVGNIVCPQTPVSPSPPAVSSSSRGSSSSVAAVAGGVGAAVVIAAAGVALWLYRRHKLTKLAPGAAKVVGRKDISFTQEAVRLATNNYSRQIGVGGFGPVFHGEIAGQEVAVKILDQNKSSQGEAEFFNEVVLLSTIHHRSLVSLVGYCHDPPQMILLYEFMRGGDLHHRLHSSKGSPPLSWLERLSIALDAARGLAYLHDGCKPQIVHRDIKTSNILLNHKLEAKLADFGMSKLQKEDNQDRSVTRVIGTIGYLDPEYHRTGLLTPESDIYSFGVVLVEILSGKSVHAEEGYILHQARNAVNSGTVDRLVDPAVGLDYSLESAWGVVEIALACSQPTGAARPKISWVVTELAKLVGIEGQIAKEEG